MNECQRNAIFWPRGIFMNWNHFRDSFSFSTSTHVPNAKSHGSEDNHTGECKDVQHRKVFQPSPEDLGFCHRLIPSLLLAVKNIPKHSWWSHIAQYKAKIIIYEYICPSSSNYRTSKNTDDKSWIKLPGNKDLALPHQFFQWIRNFYRTHASVAASLSPFKAAPRLPHLWRCLMGLKMRCSPRPNEDDTCYE